MIRVVLPLHLRTLAAIDGEAELLVNGRVTVNAILDALENRYPMLSGTIRDYASKTRRPKVRFFALETDISHDNPDTELPAAIAAGRAPLLIVGAISGG